MTKKELIELMKEKDELLAKMYWMSIEINSIKEDLETIDNKDIIIQSLLEKIKSTDLEILEKEDIMRIFNCESDKALRFLKVAMSQKYATKMGKNFIITKNNLLKYLDFMRGKDLHLM